MKSDELLTRAVESVVPEKLAINKIKSGKKLRIYLGFDPTGSRFHIGHSVTLRKLRAFQDAGHHVIFLVGSFTAMIGDPTGQDSMRQLLTREQVEKNFKTYKKQAGKILDFKNAEIVYNHKWLDKLSTVEIFDLAKNFTLQQMLQRDMFRRRMSYKAICPKCKNIFPVVKSTDVKFDDIADEIHEVNCSECDHKFKPKKNELVDEDPISPNEFLYPIMQGYDSVMLDVDFEIGGNDQLFNMLCGRKLQKAFNKREKAVLTTKIILGTDGRKMSKTYGNCIYLDTEPKDMFGQIMTVNDNLLGDYFECCTDVPMDEVKKIIKGDPRSAKVRLAKEIVTLYHDEKAAEEASKAFDKVFTDKEVPDDMTEIKVKKGTKVIDVIVENKLVSSKSEARRVIEQGGVKLNDKAVDSIDTEVEEGLTPEALAKGVTLKVGKRKFLKVII